MNKIEFRVLNPTEIVRAERMMATAARLTQRGHKINNMKDFMDLYHRNYSGELIMSLAELPHLTLQKFAVINVAIVGASRRFLAQITRHQNEVKFMSASLQYSDYSDKGAFVVPYELLENKPAKQKYLESCEASMKVYKELVKQSDNDSAGYVTPQSLRNVLIISATPYQWKHMINQRVCSRNTTETKYIMLRIWDLFYKLSPAIFGKCGPCCMYGKRCKEGKMTCGHPLMMNARPHDLLATGFPKIVGGQNENQNL